MNDVKSSATVYQGYTEMLLQEKYLLDTTGNTSGSAYVVSQRKYYEYDKKSKTFREM